MKSFKLIGTRRGMRLWCRGPANFGSVMADAIGQQLNEEVSL
jgi:hypothetical protein